VLFWVRNQLEVLVPFDLLALVNSHLLAPVIKGVSKDHCTVLIVNAFILGIEVSGYPSNELACKVIQHVSIVPNLKVKATQTNL